MGLKKDKMKSTESHCNNPSSRATDRKTVIHRSFAKEVERKLQSLQDVALETLCVVPYEGHSYPLYAVEYPPPDVAQLDERHVVFVSAGVHGDEPAGVHAALEFLQNIAPSFSQNFRFLVLPCVNPSGYAANTTETMNGANLNRLFARNSTQPEIRAIEDWLFERAVSFCVSLDLHEVPPFYVGEGFVEADNPTATYLYETVSDGSTRIGHQLLAALPDGVEVCDWPTIYNDQNDGGVIAYPEACQNPIYAEGTGLDSFLNGRFTGHSFTTETPTAWDMEKRIRAQLTYIETAIRLVAEESRPRTAER
jgi:hypothetical protein